MNVSQWAHCSIRQSSYIFGSIWRTHVCTIYRPHVCAHNCRASVEPPVLDDVRVITERESRILKHTLSRSHREASPSVALHAPTTMHISSALLLLAGTAQAHCEWIEFARDNTPDTHSRPLLQNHRGWDPRSRRMDRRAPNEELPNKLWCHVRDFPRHALLPEPRGHIHRHRRCRL